MKTIFLLILIFATPIFSSFASPSSTSTYATPIEDQLTLKILDMANHFQERPTLFIQCQLRYAIDCEQLRRIFFEKLHVLERVDNDTAMIKVLLTDESGPQGILVHSKWSSNDDISMVDFSLPDLLLPTEFDAIKIQTEMITLLAQGVLPHIRVKSGLGTEEIIIKSLKNGTTTPPGNSNGPFYMDISLSGSSFRSGIGAVNPDGTSAPSTSSVFANGSVLLNNSTERTRVYVSGNASYSKNTQPGPGNTTLSAENFAPSLLVVGVYSLTKNKRWNVAIMGVQFANPGSNLVRGRNIESGVEYNLVPFRVTESYEFRVRATASNSDDRLVMANDRGNTHENYYQAAFQLYGYWLLLNDKASLTGSISASKNLSHAGYYSASSQLSFSFQISRGVRITTSGSYRYQAKNMRFPGIPDFSNPLQTQFLSGYSGGSYSTSLGISFILGKGSSIYSRDRRFQ
ncbi:MAG: hypothetical protein QE271_13390 [Bacteriovoracaceae bacterium]|nr:hypothetical protein [Bacteriovoracaceae bacterium]